MLLIVPSLHQGGLERICVWTAQMMQEKFDVTIAAFNLSDAFYDLTGLDVRCINVPSKPGRLQKVWNVLRRAVLLRKLKRECNADISYSFGPTANRVNVLSGGQGKVWCALHSFLDLDKGGFLKSVVKHADRIICCSQGIAWELTQRYHSDKIMVLHNPYDRKKILQEAQEKDESIPEWKDEKVVINIGRCDDVKGYWHLVKSFSLVHKKLPKTKLVFLGSGDFSEYEKLAEDCGIKDAVHFAGMRTNPFPWLAKSDLFVLTSRNEGFPNALVESMVLGKAVISVNCMSGPAEILTDRYEEVRETKEVVNDGYGILIPPMPFEKNMNAGEICEEEKALAEEMIKLLTDDGKREALGKAAAKRAESYSREAYEETIYRMAGLASEQEERV